MKKGSVYCSMIFVVLFSLALIALLFFAPRIMALYAAWRLISAAVSGVVLAAFYVSALPAAVSWCFVAVAAVTLVAGFWYMPLLLVTAAMVFIFLILRIVRRCFEAALALKEENNLTI